MRLTIAKSELQDALKAVSSTVDKGGMTALQCVLIDARETMSLETTDMQSSTFVEFPALVEEQGKALVGFNQLQKYVGMLGNAAVSIEAEGDGCTVTCGKTVFAMKALDPADFPGFSEIGDGSECTMRAEDFAEAVGAVKAAVSKDETRVFSGIRFESSGGKASLAATDSYRAHKRELACGEGEVECVVPIAMAQAVASAGLAGDATLATDGKRVTFDMGVYRITSRCLEGRFPPVERILQAGNVVGKASFDQAEMRGALKRSEAAASDDVRSVKVSFGGSAVDFEVKGDKVSFTDEIEAECDGEAEVRFNPRLLLDAVQSMPDGEGAPVFEAQGANAPMLVKRDGYTAAVMPVRG